MKKEENCYWDQRGAGMTYDRELDASTAMVEQMVEHMHDVSYSLVESIVESIKVSRKELLTFEESAHSPNLEAPECFVEVVRKIASGRYNQE